MRFCANPKCRFHDVKQSRPGQPLVRNAPAASTVEVCATKEIVYNHAYHAASVRSAASGDSEAETCYFCDTCHEAIRMAIENGLRPSKPENRRNL